MPQVHQQKHSKHRMLCLYFLRKLKPFSLAEELIIPAAAVLAETMMGKTVADKIKTLPLSNDTVSRRTEKMGTYKLSNWWINSGLVNHFHFNWMNRLMSVDRRNWLLLRDMYVDTRDIQEHILFCKTL